jgi:hypothetical protein
MNKEQAIQSLEPFPARTENNEMSCCVLLDFNTKIP